jgi:hypothetical protein
MSDREGLPKRIAEALARETAGETIRWKGRPRPLRSALMTTPIWLMGIPWLAFCSGMLWALVVSMLAGPSKPAPPGTIDAWVPVIGWTMALFVVPFVLVGLGMVGAPFWVWREARRTIYAITDRRVLTLVAHRSRKVTSLTPERIVSLERTEDRAGRGSLKIVYGLERDSDGDPVEKHHMLSDVADVRRAETLVQDLAARAARRHRQ